MAVRHALCALLAESCEQTKKQSTIKARSADTTVRFNFCRSRAVKLLHHIKRMIEEISQKFPFARAIN
jgi:hypothetical protein